MATEQDRQRVRQVVVGSKIYFPPASFFNDPFDLHPVFDLTAPRHKQRKDCERLSKSCKKRDDILMWSHDADSHKGVCPEFDGMSKFMAHAQVVKYRSR